MRPRRIAETSTSTRRAPFRGSLCDFAGFTGQTAVGNNFQANIECESGRIAQGMDLAHAAPMPVEEATLDEVSQRGFFMWMGSTSVTAV